MGNLLLDDWIRKNLLIDCWAVIDNYGRLWLFKYLPTSTAIKKLSSELGPCEDQAILINISNIVKYVVEKFELKPYEPKRIKLKLEFEV